MKTINFSRINYYTILRDILTNLWVIILAALVGFFGSFSYYNYLIPAEYTAKMTVSVNLAGYANSATAVALSRTVLIAETLDDVFKSDAVRNVVVREIGENVTADINATQLGETNLISITSTDNSPEKAYATINSVMRNYQKVTDYVFSNVMINVVENPQMPSSPSNGASPLKAGVVFGFIAMLGVTALIAFLSFMRDTVKNVADVENELTARLFGTVYSTKGFNSNSGETDVGLVVTNPNVGFDFIESYRKMAVKIQSLGKTKGVKTFMVTSVAENEGKTTVAVNIATALSQDNNRVLLIDCDMRRPAVFRFFSNLPHSEDLDFSKFIIDGGDIARFIKHDTETGLYIADNIKSVSGSADILAGRHFAEILSALKEQFDFIIIDTPPCGLAVDAEAVSSVVDSYVMVVKQDGIKVSDINDHIESINTPYFAGCVFNNVYEIKRLVSKVDSEYAKYYRIRRGDLK